MSGVGEVASAVGAIQQLAQPRVTGAGGSLSVPERDALQARSLRSQAHTLAGYSSTAWWTGLVIAGVAVFWVASRWGGKS
jgi:hypothetical protein